MAQGVVAKSKNSSRFGWALSRAVRCAEDPIKRFSTNFRMAVWSMGVCDTKCFRVNGEMTILGIRNPNCAANP